DIHVTGVQTCALPISRKVFIFFLGLSALAIILTAVVVNVLNDAALVSGVNPEYNSMILEEIAASIQLIIITPLANLCLLLAIFSTASFIPNMLEKGNIDLLLSKQI